MMIIIKITKFLMSIMMKIKKILKNNQKILLNKIKVKMIIMKMITTKKVKNMKIAKNKFKINQKI